MRGIAIGKGEEKARDRENKISEKKSLNKKKKPNERREGRIHAYHL